MLDVRQEITAAIHSVLQEWGLPDSTEPVVTASAQPEFGDFSTPEPLRLAKVRRMAPLAIAQELQQGLTARALPFVEEWTVSAPGYVNCRLRNTVWAQAVIENALTLGGRTINTTHDNSPQGRILIEHTATNPNKAAHVGHLRNACIGDTVARMLRRLGHDVEVQNYIDDTGVQVADVAVGIKHLGIAQESDEPFDQYCSRVYVEVRRRYDEQPELVDLRKRMLHDIEAGDNDDAKFVKELASKIVACHLATMARFDIHYELLAWESDIIALGFWRQAFELLRETGAIVHAETGKLAGCWVMPAADGSIESEEAKVLVKSDGVATYTAKDIAYQLWKFGLLGRDFQYRPWNPADPHSVVTTAHAAGTVEAASFGRAERVINVIDTRQEYPQEIVKRGLDLLGHKKEAENSIHLSYAFVALAPSAAAALGLQVEEGKNVYALSGRQGIEVRADALLDQAIARVREKSRDESAAQTLAASAVRYYLEKFTLTQMIAFDFDLALQTTGDSGVYLMYTHARAAGILRKVPEDTGRFSVPEILDPSERALLHAIDSYPYSLAEAANGLSPATLCSYALSLASAFTDFYEHTPPIAKEADANVRSFRRALVAATKATLADTLQCLGLQPLEQI